MPRSSRGRPASRRPGASALPGLGRRLAVCFLAAGSLTMFGSSAAAQRAGNRPSSPHAAQACSPSVTALADRQRLALGGAVTVRLMVTPNCSTVPELRHLALVLQPTGDREADAALGEALAGMLEGLGSAVGPVALVSGEGLAADGGPKVWPLSADPGPVIAALRAFGGGGTPQPLDLLLRAARAEFLAPDPGRPKPLGRRTLAVVSHAAAPRGRASGSAFEVAAATEDAIELRQFCLGGGCPGLPGVVLADPPDGVALAARLGGELAAPAIPHLVRPRIYASHGTGVRYLPGSAQPEPARLGWMRGDRAQPFVAWALPEDAGAQPFEASFDLQALERGPAVLGLSFTLVEAMTSSGEEVLAFDEKDLFLDTDRLAPLASPCRLHAQAKAPVTVTLDESFSLEATVEAACPGGAAQADIVLIADRSTSMRVGQRTPELNRALHGFLRALDLNLHRLALVDLTSPPRLAIGLSQDRDALQAAVEAGRPDGDTELGASLDLARELLKGRRPGVLPLVILLTDGQTSFPRPGGDDPWLAATAWLQQDGAQVFVGCLTEQAECQPRLATLASSPAWFRHSRDSAELSAVLLELADRVKLPGLRRVILSQELHGAFFSAAPQGVDDPLYLHQRGGYVARQLPQPLVGSLRWSDAIWARALGSWPVSDRWELSWIDAEGLAGTVALPPPQIEVLAPDEGGPCRLDIAEHEAQPADVSPEVSVSASSMVAVVCGEERQDLELVLVLDHSDSMRGQRIQDLRAGVDRLLDEAAAPGLRLGMVAFSDRLLRELPLGSSAADLRQALTQIDPEGTTNIGQALNAAGSLLKASRPAAKRLVFLLTDGRNSSGPEAMRDAADRLKSSEQVELAAVCLAQACDADLASMVSRPGYYTDLADSRDLAGFFSRFAAAVAGRAPVSAELREQPGAAFEVLRGSARPLPAFEPDPHVWQASFPGQVPFDVQLSYRAAWPGLQPLSLWSRVDYQYIGGFTGRLYLPARPVMVRGQPGTLPTAEPLPPTATRGPEVTATVTPVATPSATLVAPPDASPTPGIRGGPLLLPKLANSGAEP